MTERATASFVKQPRTIHDLYRLHCLDKERPYQIVKEIVLAAIDYENLCTDMLADRDFLEEGAGLCSLGDPIKCMLIRHKTQAKGILVVPDADRRDSIGFAALAVTESVDCEINIHTMK